MAKMIELTGQKFGRLTVIGLHSINEKRIVRWSCVCDCGKITFVLGSNLRKGNTKSCGCFGDERRSLNNLKHSYSKRSGRSKEYVVWTSMKSRCLDPNNKRYNYYSGREITICDRWFDFENFLADMGERPSSKHSIERIDNDGNYEPENCKWATPTEQNRNKRTPRNNTSGFKGVYWHKKYMKWSSSISVESKLMHIGYFTNIEDAITARREAELKYWQKSS